MIGISNISISACSNSKNKTYMGYVWKFKCDPFVLIVDTKSRPVIQYSIDGNFIANHNSIKDAAIILGIKEKSATAISAVCRGVRGRIQAYGFIWRYKQQAA